MSSKPVFKDNTYEYDFTVRKKNTSTKILEPVTGLADLKGLIAATPDGLTINAALELTLAERAGAPGSYFAIVPASAINTWLFGAPPNNYDGKLVYVCCRNPDVDEYDEVGVFAVRPMGS